MNETAYYSDPRLSATEIKAFALGGESGFIHARDEKDSPAMKLGRAIHCAVLQPDEFQKGYAVQKFDGRTKEGKAEKADAEAKGISLLAESDFYACTYAHELIAMNGLETESEFYTSDCKCKVDALDRESGLLVEFKTISDIFAAEKDFWARAYDLQLGHYANVLSQNGVAIKAVKVIFFAPSQGLTTTLEIDEPRLAEFRSRAAAFAGTILGRKSLFKDRTADFEKARIPSPVLGERPQWVADREDVFLL